MEDKQLNITFNESVGNVKINGFNSFEELSYQECRVLYSLLEDLMEWVEEEKETNENNEPELEDDGDEFKDD